MPDIKVTVLARNPELREIGAGLTLWTNGVQVLRQLGLADGHEQQTDLLVGADGLYAECCDHQAIRSGRQGWAVGAAPALLVT
jgi:hypothetical protein